MKLMLELDDIKACVKRYLLDEYNIDVKLSDIQIIKDGKKLYAEIDLKHTDLMAESDESF